MNHFSIWAVLPLIEEVLASKDLMAFASLTQRGLDLISRSRRYQLSLSFESLYTPSDEPTRYP
jgi:hypothetical protein